MKRYAVTLLVNLKVGVNEILKTGQKFVGPFDELSKPIQDLITNRRLMVANVVELKPEVEEAEIDLADLDVDVPALVDGLPVLSHVLVEETPVATEGDVITGDGSGESLLPVDGTENTDPPVETTDTPAEVPAKDPVEKKEKPAPKKRAGSRLQRNKDK